MLIEKAQNQLCAHAVCLHCMLDICPVGARQLIPLHLAFGSCCSFALS